METIGDRINYLRKEHGYSYAELARMAGISVSYLYRLGQDQRRLNIDILMSFAEVFDVSLDYLVFGDNRGFDFLDLYLTIGNNLNKLSIEERMKLISLLSK